MPIRLNLLAEAQALQEVRRRDPIKRVLLVGVSLVILMLVWASSLQVRALMDQHYVNRVLADVQANEPAYQAVMTNRQQIAEARDKLLALHSLTTNRFLNGTLLHALQQVTTDDVQLSHLKVTQSYLLTEQIKARTNGSKVVPGSPATVTEKIVLTLEGNDNSASPGDQLAKYKETLTAHAYFRDQLSAASQFNLKNLSAPQTSLETGRPTVHFTLEFRFPEKTR